jgi:hypothetical protein
VPAEESAPHHRWREREVRQPRTAERHGDATAQARSVPVSLAAPGPVSQRGRDEQAGRVRVPARGLWGGLADRRWPLFAVLAVQAALSLRLVWSNTAFQDEGLYLWAGHLELAHAMQGTRIPAFATYFSGAPTIYPPIGAVADSIGGLAGARLLSLVFMLIATILLHGVTRRLFVSRASAFFAAALFAGLGSAQFLGAFATYDAMALMLLALATWFGVRAAFCRPPARVALISAAAVVLTGADATKYATALFDPVVVAVAALAVWRLRGRAAGLAAAVVMTVATLGLLAGAYRVGGPSYAQGIKFTTLSRTLGVDPALSVMAASARWTGISAALGVIGAVIISHAWRDGPTTALAWTLAAAIFLAPLEQARLHTYVSLFKHVGYGAWFASAVGGYLLAAAPRAVRASKAILTLRAGVIAVALAGLGGLVISGAQYGSWQDSRALTAALGRLEKPGGRYLAEDYDVPAYYLRSSVQWSQWSNTWYFGYTDPGTGEYLQQAPAYADAIRHHYFTTIVLSFGDTSAVDQIIVRDIKQYGGYQLIAVIPFRTDAGSSAYKIWMLAPFRDALHRTPGPRSAGRRLPSVTSKHDVQRGLQLAGLA